MLSSAEREEMFNNLGTLSLSALFAKAYMSQ